MKPIQTIHFKTIDSTNSFAKKNVKTFSKDHLTLITADRQLQGRGQFDRTWHSPSSNNIYATLCLFLKVCPKWLANLPQLLMLSCQKELSAFASCLIKWPNDLFIQGKKVGGVLTETVCLDEGFFVFLGLGINCNMNQRELSSIGSQATSLQDICKQAIDEKKLLEQIVATFQEDLAIFEQSGFPPFFSTFATNLIHKFGEKLFLRYRGETFSAFFHSVREDGSLTIYREGQGFKHYYSVEVVDSGNP